MWSINYNWLYEENVKNIYQCSFRQNQPHVWQLDENSYLGFTIDSDSKFNWFQSENIAFDV